MNRAMCVKGVWTLMLMAALVAVNGCGEKDEPQSKAEGVSKEEVKQEAKEAYEATKAYTEEQVEAFRQATEAKLAEYDQKIDQLQESVEELGGDAKVKAEQQLAALRRKRDAVSEQMEELVDSGGSAWDQLKSGIDSAMEDLADAYNNAVAEFSKP